MIISNISETKAHLSQLINRVLAGDEVIIAKGNEPLVKMIPIHQDTSPRIGGQWAGFVEIGEKFEFTEQELGELFYAPLSSDKP
jgi:prevent-host-death family protein